MEMVISQILAAAALVLFMVSYFVREKYKFLFIQLIATAFNAASFIVIGAFIGGAVTFVSALRTASFFVLERRKFPFPAIFLPCFVALYSVPSFILYTGWSDLLAWLAPILSTIALLFRNMKAVKIITILSILIFAGYSIIVNNWVSTAELFIEAIIVVVSLVLENIQTKKIKQKE